MINSKNNNKRIYPKKNNSSIYSTSLIFEQNIDKLWIFLRDLNNEEKFIDYSEDLKSVKGDNTWTKGNIFTCNWIGFNPLKIIRKNIYSDRNKKVIKWKVIEDIGSEYYKEVNLYKITQNGKTLVKSVISKTEKKNELIDSEATKNYYLNLEYNMLLEKSNYLKNIKEDVFIYESCIINSNYLNIWNFILDFKKNTKIGVNYLVDLEYNTPGIKEGTFVKFFLNDLKIKIFMKVKEIKNLKKEKTWKIKLETICANIENLPKTVEYKIIIINNNKTQLSSLQIFKNNTNKEFLKKVSFIQKELLKNFKKYFEEKM